MYIITGLIGILLGVVSAKRRNGKLADILHYGAAFGIAFAVLGFILALIIEKNFY
ncbi:hypothetical protein [Cognatishimia maritima]|uniref:PEP-CTERM protein-sorting domain-containing protein n=1 Tax=Cognatishimia maritima TaxID=870908 RepID=A0A1M5IYQ7_9RHOB|nr:hypothetical protein [Cognatishimia maritima]SHG33498.1 hypothetical protein SAMN04488044_0491 [Cognatishimia maritima]